MGAFQDKTKVTVCIVEDYIYWLWLSLAGGVNNNKYSLLLERFGDAEGVYRATMNEYKCIEGLDRDFAVRLTDKELAHAREILDFCKNHSVRLLHCLEPDYPVKLKWIYACPLLLYVYGDLPNLNEMLTVAIVGTRGYTEYGRIAAYRIGGGLARARSVVVSGLALGIDGIAQLACINNGGKTVAVMGTGIDRIYPKEHRELAKLVAQNGAIVTEFPPGSAPLPHHFPIRNRIMSGLSDAVALIECNERSGALITTKYATEQSRSVYAVPGDITSPTSFGPLSLLKDGAKPITTAADIIEDFVCQYSYLNSVLENTNFDVNMSPGTQTPYNDMLISEKTKKKRKSETELFNAKNDGEESVVGYKNKPCKKEASKKPDENNKDLKEETRLSEKPIPEGLSELEKQIYIRIKETGKINADGLVSSELNTAKVMSALTILEIGGHITSLPGGFYELTKQH